MTRWFRLESLAGILVFALPLFAVSVRHWISTSFVLLGLLGLIALWRRGADLRRASKSEWVLMALIALFFLAFVAASLANGWNEDSTKGLGNELRFLLIIPIFLLVRRVPKLSILFGWGCLFAVFFNFGLVIYEIQQLDLPRVDGIYGPLFLGPVTVIFAAIATQSLVGKHEWINVGLIMLLMLMAAVVAAYSSRSALIGLGVLGIMLVLTRVTHCRWWLLLTVLVLGVVGLQFSDLAKSRVQIAYDEVSAYLGHAMAPAVDGPNPHGFTPVGVRLEMLKAAGMVVQDAPWLGVGRGGYNAYVSKLADQGKLNPAVSDHSHPHNIFAETLFSKGLIGLIILLSILLYAAWYFFKDHRLAPRESWAGLTFLVVILSTQLTESAMVNKGNYIALFLIGLSVLFVAKNQALASSWARSDETEASGKP